MDIQITTAYKQLLSRKDKISKIIDDNPKSDLWESWGQLSLITNTIGELIQSLDNIKDVHTIEYYRRNFPRQGINQDTSFIDKFLLKRISCYHIDSYPIGNRGEIARFQGVFYDRETNGIVNPPLEVLKAAIDYDTYIFAKDAWGWTIYFN